MRRTGRLTRALVIAGALAFAIACSSGSDDAPAAPADDTEAPEDAADDADSQEPINLVVADSNPPGHYNVTHGITPWMERVTELTDGQVTFEYFPAEQLGAELDLLTMIRGGTADIGYLPTGFFAGEMPVSAILTLPGLFSDSTVASQAFYDATMNTEMHEHDWTNNNVRLLFGVMLQPYNVLTSQVEVNSIEDLAGLTLKTGGAYQNRILEELGAIPNEMPTPETYQGIQLGTLDGAIFPITSVDDFNLGEVLCCVSLGWNLTSFYTPYAINEDVWQSLPAHVQEAMNTASQEVIAALGEEVDSRTEPLPERFAEEDGLTVTTISDEEKQRVDELTAGVRQEWIDNMEQYGVDGQAILDYLEQRIAELGG